MANENYGHVQIELSPVTKKYLHWAVSKAVPKDFLYKSSVVSYINGDVTNVAHITVCWGVENADLDEKFRNSGMRLTSPERAKIVKVGFFEGDRGEYFPIYAAPELGPEVNKLNDWIRKNNKISPISLDFVSHITLCYVKNVPKVNIKELVNKISKVLVGSEIEFDRIYFYKPETEERVLLGK